MQHARDRIRELPARERLLLSVEDVGRDVNNFLRGWAGYFRYGNSARSFDKIGTYPLGRLSLFVAKRHRRSRGCGWLLVAYESPDRMGLINLNGCVLAPRPHRSCRESRMPAVKDVGEPGEGEPHARFDGGGRRPTPLGRGRAASGASCLPERGRY